MPVTMLKNKVMYRQFIHRSLFQLQMLYMFKTFLSLLSGPASYLGKEDIYYIFMTCCIISFIFKKMSFI